MKQFLKIIGLSVSTLSLMGPSIAQKRPNIIWLMAEDIGNDLECYGMKAVKTPNINKLAEEGIMFTNCYCTNSICSPSRSAMMTGVHQLKINAQNHRSNRDIPLQEPYKPFTYFLRKAGYTCILGNHQVMGLGRKTDVNFKSTALGTWDGKENFGLFDKYDEFTPKDQPFFAQIQLLATHRGDWWSDVRAKSKHPVDPNKVVLPPYMADDPAIRLDWAKYLDQMEYIDNEVRLLVQELKDKGLYENTVIIFIGDNGRGNIRGKGYLFEPGLHIPLIIRYPKEIKSGQVRKDVVSTTDITATILDLAKAEMPDYLDGSSFLKPKFKRDYVFSTRDQWDEIMDKSRSLSSKKYKYIRNDKPEMPYDAHQVYLEFYSPATHVMRKLYAEGKLDKNQQLFFNPTKPKEQLFNIEKDPDELNNLADDPKYKSILDELRGKLVETEKMNTSKDQTFHPVRIGTLDIINWLKTDRPEVYKEMQNGVEVGFRKYTEEYNKAHLILKTEKGKKGKKGKKIPIE